MCMSELPSCKCIIKEETMTEKTKRMEKGSNIKKYSLSHNEHN